MNDQQLQINAKEYLKLKEELERKELIIKNMEAQLQESAVIFNTILDGSLAGYWDWHIPDNYEYMSPTFKKMFGYEDHELPNRPESWQKIIHPDDLPVVLQQFEKHVLSKGKIRFDNEVRYFHKDGSIVWVYCRGEVIEWDSEGNPLRMVGCHVNITPLKKVTELKVEKKELQKKNVELEQFAYIASHDLQEPLRTVKSFASILGRKYADKFDDEGVKYLNFITEGADRMADLIRALLDYSRIGKDSIFKKVDVNKLLIHIQHDFNVLIKESNAIIQYSELPVINAYPVEMKLLLQNLTRNAIKFQKKGAIPIVQIDAKLKGDFWEFSVKDNGIGIPENKLEEIFIIFRRLHLRSTYEGTGIGLAHCKKIVELHEGNIWVESKIDEGSCFYFTIPV